MSGEGAGILVVSALAGALLGGLYFGTLWLVVRRLPRLRHPAAWLLATTVVRLALLLAGFLVVMGGRWERLLACVGGFVGARLALTAWARWGARGRGRTGGTACGSAPTS